jgi:Sulfotransferase family
VKPQVLTSDLRAKLSSVRVANSCATLRNFPDFLIVGPQRTGTTWLFHNLKSHPEIFLPKEKELYYFSTLGMPNHRRFRFPYLEDYLYAMADTPRSTLKKNYDSLRKVGRLYKPRMRGEATASYAALPKEVIREIATLNPDLKAILMIRDPVDRAWSHARKDLLREGQPSDVLDPDALARLLFKDEQRGLALYRTLIENWRSHLQPGHLFVGMFDSIASEPERLLAALHGFLGVASGRRYFGRFLRHRINPAPAATIPPEMEKLLREVLRHECEEYAELLSQITASGEVFRCY